MFRQKQGVQFWVAGGSQKRSRKRGKRQGREDREDVCVPSSVAWASSSESKVIIQRSQACLIDPHSAWFCFGFQILNWCFKLKNFLQNIWCLTYIENIELLAIVDLYSTRVGAGFTLRTCPLQFATVFTIPYNISSTNDKYQLPFISELNLVFPPPDTFRKGTLVTMLTRWLGGEGD